MLFNLFQHSSNRTSPSDAVDLDEEEEDYGAVDEFEEEEEDNEDEDLDEEEDDDEDTDEDLDDDESPRKQPYAVYSGEDEEEGDYTLPYSVAR